MYKSLKNILIFILYASYMTVYAAPNEEDISQLKRSITETIYEYRKPILVAAAAATGFYVAKKTYDYWFKNKKDRNGIDMRKLAYKIPYRRIKGKIIRRVLPKTRDIYEFRRIERFSLKAIEQPFILLKNNIDIKLRSSVQSNLAKPVSNCSGAQSINAQEINVMNNMDKKALVEITAHFDRHNEVIPEQVILPNQHLKIPKKSDHITIDIKCGKKQKYQSQKKEWEIIEDDPHKVVQNWKEIGEIFCKYYKCIGKPIHTIVMPSTWKFNDLVLPLM